MCVICLALGFAPKAPNNRSESPRYSGVITVLLGARLYKSERK